MSEELKPIYYMRDDHTFKHLSVDVDTAIVEIEAEFNAGYTCGMLCSKRPGFKNIHAQGDETRFKFFAECKKALESALTAAPTPPAQSEPDQFVDANKMVAPVALSSVRLTRDTAGMCIVSVNGRVAIRDNGDIIDHIATLEWFAASQQPAVPEDVARVNQQMLEALEAIASDYAERFDLSSPSTNPGIKSTIAQARAAIDAARKAGGAA